MTANAEAGFEFASTDIRLVAKRSGKNFNK